MQRSKHAAITLVGELYKSLQIIGHAGVQKILKTANKDDTLFREHVSDYIVGRVCKGFHISRSELLNGKSKGIRIDALMVTYTLMKECIDYSIQDISSKLYKEESLIRKTIAEFKKLNRNIKHHAVTLDKHETIEMDVNRYMDEERKRRKQWLTK